MDAVAGASRDRGAAGDHARGRQPDLGDRSLRIVEIETSKLVASKAFRAKTKSREYFDDDGRVQPVHFDAGWIPFAEDSGGNLLCLDTNPGPQGRANQIIQWEIRGGGAFVRAASLAAYLKSLG